VANLAEYSTIDGLFREAANMVTRKDIETQASHACINHLLRRTVGVINQIRVQVGPKRDSEVAGTGSLVEWNKRRLVITAKHVIDNIESPSDIRIAAFEDSAVVFKQPEEVRKEEAYAGIQLGPDSEIHLCGWEDVAAVTIPGPAFAHCPLVDVKKDWSDPPQGEIVMGCGFPVDNRVFVGQRKVGERTEIDVGVMPIIFDGAVLPRPTASDLKFKITGDHSIARHYLVPYKHNASTHPGGLSGGAAWWEPEGKMLVWRPRFHFAGVCLAVYMNGYSHHKGPVIRVLKASVVRRFLRQTFGPRTKPRKKANKS
jgi:hypothetical protein